LSPPAIRLARKGEREFADCHDGSRLAAAAGFIRLNALRPAKRDRGEGAEEEMKVHTRSGRIKI
jgi:hypothetical protein